MIIQAKTNTLKLNDRKQFVNKNTTCPEILRLYEEDRERVIANVLFTKEIQDMEQTKKSIPNVENEKHDNKRVVRNNDGILILKRRNARPFH